MSRTTVSRTTSATFRSSPLKIIRSHEEVDCKWLAQALDIPTVSSFTIDRFSKGQAGAVYHLDLSYPLSSSGPRSVVLKLVSPDPASRQTAAKLGLYRNEVLFYTKVGPLLKDIPLLQCYHAAFEEEGDYCSILLEYAGGMTEVDDFSGATPGQIQLAVKNLAHFHGSAIRLRDQMPDIRRGDISQELMETMLDKALQKYQEDLSGEHVSLLKDFIQNFDKWNGMRKRSALIGMCHGDFRLDNMLFGKEPESQSLKLLDWQSIRHGEPVSDLAYFLGSSMEEGDRRKYFEGLVETYIESLGPGVDLSVEKCYEEIRLQAPTGARIFIMASCSCEATEHGKKMNLLQLKRACQFMLDMKSLELIKSS